MKNLVLLALCQLVLSTLFAQNISYNWTKTFTDPDQISGTNVHAFSDVVYLYGTFADVIYYSDTSGLDSLVSRSFRDLFLFKLNAEGQVLWAKAWYSENGSFSAGDIVTDADGNIYLSGAVRGLTNFDYVNGTAEYESDNNNSFVAKYSANGEYLWHYTAEGYGRDFIGSLSIDQNYNVYAFGTYQEEVRIPVENDTIVFTSNDSYNAFFLKLNANAQGIWANQIVGMSDASGGVIACNQTDKVALSFGLTGNHVLESQNQSDSISSSSVSKDGLVAIYDFEGNILNYHVLSSDSHNFAQSICFDLESNLYVAGSMVGAVDFDPSPNYLVHNNEISSAFLVKYNDEFEVQWLKTMEGGGMKSVHGLQTFNSGEIMLAGNYWLNLWPDSATYLAASGSQDFYFSKFSSEGDLLQAHSIGGVGYDFFYDLSISPTANIYLTGVFEQTIDFDFSDGNDYHSGAFLSTQFLTQLTDLDNFEPINLRIDLVDHFVFAPNPASDFICIKNKPLGQKYSIYNCSGALVKEGIFSKPCLNIADLPEGAYFLKSKRGSVSQKFLKL